MCQVVIWKNAVVLRPQVLPPMTTCAPPFLLIRATPAGGGASRGQVWLNAVKPGPLQKFHDGVSPAGLEEVGSG